MNADYYSLLVKAVAGKDVAARNKVYKDAYDIIRRAKLSRAETSSYIAALEDAVRRIENDIAGEARSDQRSPAAINEVLAPRNWRPLVTSAAALIGVIALAAILYGYLATRDPRGATTAAAPRPTTERVEKVVADLDPGIDGGWSAANLPYAFQRQVVFYRTTVVPGSIVVDRDNRYLYLIVGNNSARRYGIGIAQECLKGGSLFKIANKVEWPVRSADADGTVSAQLATNARPGSPLGSRALLLDKPGLIIHGTNSPTTIGHLVSSGCIRLVNEDVEDLYRRVPLDTRVVFVS